MNDPVLENAKRLHQSGNLPEAVRIYQQILKANPWHVEAIGSLALAHFQVSQFEEAQRLFGEMARIKPDAADAQCFRGVALLQLGRPAEALLSLDAALAVNPNFTEAMTNRATALLALQRLDEALAAFDATLGLVPGDANAWNNRGNALLQMDRPLDAIASYERAIAVNPRHAEAWFNRGNALAGLGRYDEALASFGNALSFRPNYPEAWASRGQVLATQWKFPEAVASFDKAISIKPDAALYATRAEVLYSAGRIEDAIKDCDTVLKRNPDYPFVRGNLAFWHLVRCEWRTLDAEKSEIARRLRFDQPVVYPFMNVTLSSSAADQLRCAQVWAKNRYPVGPEKSSPNFPSAPFERPYVHDRIRLGYFSADFCNHATAHLIAGLIERHDRAKFEPIAFSFGVPTKDAERERLEKSFERFIDVNYQSDHDVALLARRLEVDIAVDLKGFTRDSRTDVFSLRAAPIQVSYLGYPGTMGVDFIDYIVADRTVIPDEDREFYTEKIAYLPDSYQANDTKRKIADRHPTRAEAGLPETGFVFCSFNNSYKLTPQIFDIWMRLLGKTDGSVLWLLKDNATASKNLMAEAQARGIAPTRIVFAERIDHSEHLARHRLADLFLDTLPYNAHTTASDALWAGLPVLTCVGTTFAGRVAASLLKAVGLPELITRDFAEYEALALELAANPQRLQSVKQKLVDDRLTCPLFDTARFTRHIESAYVAMWERHQAGLAPKHIHVQPD